MRYYYGEKSIDSLKCILIGLGFTPIDIFPVYGGASHVKQGADVAWVGTALKDGKRITLECAVPVSRCVRHRGGFIVTEKEDHPHSLLRYWIFECVGI